MSCSMVARPGRYIVEDNFSGRASHLSAYNVALSWHIWVLSFSLLLLAAKVFCSGEAGAGVDGKLTRCSTYIFLIPLSGRSPFFSFLTLIRYIQRFIGTVKLGPLCLDF